MFCKMKYFSIAIFLALVQFTFTANPSKTSNTVDVSTVPPTTPHPTSIKLEQFQKMEESALKGWYDMVNRFLMIIKPDHQTLDYVIDFLSGKPDLDIQATVLKIAKMNYAFLTMVIIGIVYICVMLITGICFFCCRFCGRCGAKDSQRQRRSDNCWRTMHKFCLILMIAFLVVPITCMLIINQHIKESSDGVKGNATDVFEILIEFANETDDDVDRKLHIPLTSPLQNFDSFKSHFVELLHDNISSSIDHEKLEEIKNIVTWVLSVEDQHTEIANATALSKAIKDLKSRIAEIRRQTESINCSDPKRKICSLDLKQLPLEKINLDEEYVHVQSEFQKLLKINFEELKSIIDQIQNNTVLKSKIEEESESLRRFAEDAKPSDHQVQKNIKNEIKTYTEKLRTFAYRSKRELSHAFVKVDEYEDYRWYVMFGVAAILVIPVTFLCLGLICGCCGYEKERHPTKRSSTSNCGGLCLILAVYYFFLISSILMVITMFLFVLGGNMQTFVCIPLYQENFEILDQIKEKFNPQLNNTIFQNVTPSQFLTECKDDKSIIYALGILSGNNSQGFEKLLSSPAVENSVNNEEIDNKLRDAILEITSGIREKLEQFTNALNLKDMKDIPLKLQESLKNSKANLSQFIDEVRNALNEDTNGNVDTLHFVNESAAVLFEVIDDFEKKLNNFSTPLLNIYREADNYKDKIREIEKSLDKVEDKLPKVIRTHLFQAVASSAGVPEMVADIGKCYKVWISFSIARTAVCEFVVYPINGFWFALGWALIFIIPTIFFSVKLSRYYLRMKYDDDPYIHDSGEAMPLEEHQFSQHQNYMVHPTTNQARQFHFK